MEPIKRLLTSEGLFGIPTPANGESFVLDIEAAKEERAEEIQKNNWIEMTGGLGEVLRRDFGGNLDG